MKHPPIHLRKILMFLLMLYSLILPKTVFAQAVSLGFSISSPEISPDEPALVTLTLPAAKKWVSVEFIFHPHLSISTITTSGAATLFHDEYGGGPTVPYIPANLIWRVYQHGDVATLSFRVAPRCTGRGGPSVLFDQIRVNGVAVTIPTAKVQAGGCPDRVEITPAWRSGAAQGAAVPVTVVVTDANGAPVRGIPVSIVSQEGPNTNMECGPGGTFSMNPDTQRAAGLVLNGTTDVNGEAHLGFFGYKEGVDILSVQTTTGANVRSNAVSVTWTAPGPDKFQVLCERPLPPPSILEQDDPNGPPTGNIRCALETETCFFSGSQLVYYGHEGHWTHMTLTGGTPCGNDVFGDPSPGVQKSCYIAASTFVVGAPPVSDLRCADETGTCYFNGTQDVFYGSEGSWTYRTLSNATSCNNEVFGDPTPGVRKSCFVAGAAVPSDFQQCARENETCSFSGTRTVYYGEDDRWFQRVLTGGTPCSNDVFGDPNLGIVKHCYIQSR